jgi:hypothetical protein
MRRKVLIALVILCGSYSVKTQNQLFKGNNLLMPSNLLINYAVNLDTCFDLSYENGINTTSKAFVENKQENDLFAIMLKPILEGKINCYATNSWISYGLMEDKRQLLLPEIKERLTGSDSKAFDAKELKGLKFIEEWEVSDQPFLFKKRVMAYMPIRYYLKNSDTAYSKMRYKIPFTIVDTIRNEHDILESDKRMKLINEIAYEYLLFADYRPPFDVEDALKTHDSISKTLDGYLLNKECAEYLSFTGISNFINLLVEKIIKGELKAYSIANNQELLAKDVKRLLGYNELTIESGSVGDTDYQKVITPMDLQLIKSIVFFEKWYIDPINLRMQKKVIAIAPVIHYYKDSFSEEPISIRKMLFKVYFNEPKNQR